MPVKHRSQSRTVGLKSAPGHLPWILSSALTAWRNRNTFGSEWTHSLQDSTYLLGHCEEERVEAPDFAGSHLNTASFHQPHNPLTRCSPGSPAPDSLMAPSGWITVIGWGSGGPIIAPPPAQSQETFQVQFLLRTSNSNFLCWNHNLWKLCPNQIYQAPFRNRLLSVYQGNGVEIGPCNGISAAHHNLPAQMVELMALPAVSLPSWALYSSGRKLP